MCTTRRSENGSSRRRLLDRLTDRIPLHDLDEFRRVAIAGRNAINLPIVQVSDECRTCRRRRVDRVASASMVSNTGWSSNLAELLITLRTSLSRCLLLQRLGEFLFQVGVGCAKAVNVSFRLRSGRTKTANALFGSSPPCETRSPRRHSHWSPSGRAQPRIEPVNPNRTAR